MKLKEIASRIGAHLKRFEASPTINKPPPPVRGHQQLHPYYMAGAYASGARVFVRYVSYQHTSSLTKKDAETYLAWLDAGNIGTHHAALRDRLKP